MTVQIAAENQEDLVRITAIVEKICPWPGYSWRPQWPGPWVLIVDEKVAAQVLRELYATPGQQDLAEQIAEQVPDSVQDAAAPSAATEPEPAPAVVTPPPAVSPPPVPAAPAAAPVTASVAAAPSPKKAAAPGRKGK